MLSDLFPHDPMPYLLGGMWIGLAIGLLYVCTGRLGGVSTTFSSTWALVLKLSYFRQPRIWSGRGWRLAYALGLMAGGFYWLSQTPNAMSLASGLPGWRLFLGGLIAGVGARMASGCTAGHGICGMGSLRKASFVAVPVFLIAAIITANVLQR
jgi:uncharacterized protein